MDEAAIGQDRPLIDRLDTGSLIPVKRSSGRKPENIGTGKGYGGNFCDIRDIWPGVSLAVSSIIDVDVIITLGKRHRHNNQTCQLKQLTQSHKVSSLNSQSSIIITSDTLKQNQCLRLEFGRGNGRSESAHFRPSSLKVDWEPWGRSPSGRRGRQLGGLDLQIRETMSCEIAPCDLLYRMTYPVDWSTQRLRNVFFVLRCGERVLK
uniref:Uncharacterized protein n=1 Tax=Branchiostoma floridae TaxID=7739 RepID=C3XR09_BRAFL|eukprot:XP_002613118.1 hypothetical protein BRAFLDRAFT_73021 [Branchiostoma floridae]